MVNIICDHCKKEFKGNKDRLKSERTFCSRICKNTSHSERNSIIKNCKFCGSKFKIRKSESHKFLTCFNPKCRKLNKMGKNNPNYRHGLANTFKTERQVEMNTARYKRWRLAVLERDNYTCQNPLCERTNRKLDVDHIKSWRLFPELRYEIENGRSLCRPCHKMTFRDFFIQRSLLEKGETVENHQPKYG